jgi:hypothetical protein
LKRLTNTSKGRYQDNLQEKKISAKCTQATKKKTLTIWIFSGWFRDSFDPAVACDSESLWRFSVSASELGTGTTDETSSSFGNASGASVSKRILSKGI